MNYLLWMAKRSILFVITCWILLLQLACVHRTAVRRDQAAGTKLNRYYADIQAGWRIRVMVPLLRSGGYLLKSAQIQAEGNSMSVNTGGELLGYELAYYKITARESGGIRIDFSSAKAWEKDKFHDRNTPTLPLFEKDGEARYLRLVYLIRESHSDHDMAIVTAVNEQTLEERTQAVVEHSDCTEAPGGNCRWVPRGVAVTPEERLKIDGKWQWRPAR